MALTLNEIKENYASFSDSKLELIAKDKAESLSPDVLEILRAELLKRDISLNELMSNLQKDIEAKDLPLERKFYVNPSRISDFSYLIGFVSLIYIFLGYRVFELGHSKMGRRLIAWVFFINGLYGFYSIIRQRFNRTVLLETQTKDMTVSLHVPWYFQIPYIGYVKKVISNSFKTINIPYTQILSIYKQDSFWVGKIIKISFEDEQGEISEAKTSLNLLNLDDLPELRRVLKMKYVKGMDI